MLHSATPQAMHAPSALGAVIALERSNKNPRRNRGSFESQKALLLLLTFCVCLLAVLAGILRMLLGVG